AAVRHVVHDPVTIGREVAQIAHLHVERPAVDRPADDARGQRLLDHRRENCDDVERHLDHPTCYAFTFNSINPSGGSIRMRLPTGSISRQIPAASGTRISPPVPSITNRLPVADPSTSLTTPTMPPLVVSTRQPIKSCR